MNGILANKALYTVNLILIIPKIIPKLIIPKNVQQG